MTEHDPKSDTVFDGALTFVLGHEGGLVDDPADPGGATNFGVSLRHAVRVGDIDGDGVLEFDLDGDGDVDADDIRMMSPARAAEEWRRLWDAYDFGDIADAFVAAKLFDLHAPTGFGGASRIAQRALRACGWDRIREDGFMGPVTIAALNEVDREHGAYCLISAISAEAAGYFRSLRSARFEAGWLARAYHRPDMADD